MGIVSYFKAKVGTKFRGHANKHREKRDDGVQTLKISTMKKIEKHVSKNTTPQVNEEPIASTSTNESSNNMVAVGTYLIYYFLLFKIREFFVIIFFYKGENKIFLKKIVLFCRLYFLIHKNIKQFLN